MAKQEPGAWPPRSDSESWFDFIDVFRLPESWVSFPRGPWSLRVEEYREDEKLVIRLDAPGIDQDKNVDIRVLDRTLQILVEPEESEDRSAKLGYRSELRYGGFSRSLSLPSGADAD